HLLDRLFDWVLLGDGLEVLAHDVHEPRARRVAPVRDAAHEDVAAGDHADQPAAVVGDEHVADVAIAHHTCGVLHACVRLTHHGVTRHELANCPGHDSSLGGISCLEAAL